MEAVGSDVELVIEPIVAPTDVAMAMLRSEIDLVPSVDHAAIPRAILDAA